MNTTLEKKLELLPSEPGCYLYKNNIGEIIYVGKAKNLKNRVKSYFTGTHNKKTQTLVSKIEDLEYIIVNSEKEALLLENNLIKKYRPYFNIRLKDDKSYPYLMITKEEHPRLLMTRKYKKNNKNIYFGPYVDIKSANEVKKMLDKIYPLRRCNPVEKRPCMYYQIGECIGPCAKTITPADYKERIAKIRNFLQGDTKEILVTLNEKMQNYISNLEFEAAAQIHSYIKSIKVSIENQTVADSSNIDKDYIGFVYNDDYICIQIFLSRMGNIIERKVEYFNLYDEPEEILYSYLVQYYTLNKLPKEIFIKDIDTELLEKVIGVKVLTPKKGNNKKLLTMVEDNARYFLENNLKIEELKEANLKRTLTSLARKIGIDSVHSIDAFDNSNIMGVDAVSVKVNFTDGKKNTYNYRKFKVKETEGINDIQTMKEVLYRNYKDGTGSTNLVVVDGGKNHVNAAIEILHEKLNLDIKSIALAKNDKHITEYIVTDDYEIITLEKNSPEYLFLKQIQDEVHRFAITYHRATKTKNMFTSKLDDVPGIGKTRKNLLISTFSSLEEIKNAPEEKLLSLGIPKNIIKNLREQL